MSAGWRWRASRSLQLEEAVDVGRVEYGGTRGSMAPRSPIGHPHVRPIAALTSGPPQVQGRSLALVPVSAVVRHRMAEKAEPQR